MTAAMQRIATSRPLLLTSALVTAAAVFTAFALWEDPRLGIGHFFYLPIALLALATGPLVGLLGGVIAAALFIVGIGLNPHLNLYDDFELGSVFIRLAMYGGVGALIGYFSKTQAVLICRLEDLSQRDHLTRLLNFRAFEAAIRSRCARRMPFALVLADMDDLKEINDREGHSEGNRALELFARTLGSAVSQEDELARIGGDEFAIVTSVSDSTAAKALSAKLEALIESVGLRGSFGWAVFPVDGENGDELFRVADGRLYQSKAGRKRARSDLRTALPRDLDAVRSA